MALEKLLDEVENAIVKCQEKDEGRLELSLRGRMVRGAVSD